MARALYVFSYDEMSWRFRRSVKLFPGVRFNISKTGISTTLGPPGASVNLGKRGSRATVGLPGTGISYSTLLSSGRQGQHVAGQPTTPNSGKISGAGWLVAMLLALLAIGRCASSTTDSGPNAAVSTAAAVSASSRYVTARSLNCRAGPAAGTRVLRALARGEMVDVAEESEGWSKIAGPAACWASTSHLSSAAPPMLGFIDQQSESGSPGETQNASSGSSSGAAMAAAGLSSATYVSSRKLSGSSRASPATKARRKKKSSGSGYGGSSCPCSGRNICVGPRGGRYCITSGGNKRYGV